MKRLVKRSLGDSGIEVSVLGVGCNQFGGKVDAPQTRAVLDAAVEQGVTFLDTSDSYAGTRSEELLGEALKGRRDSFVLGTKFSSDLGDGWPGPRGRGDYIRHAVENSLRRLQTDYIDVYWYHKPDKVTPIGETLEALDQLVKAGTVRAIGISNYSAELLEQADTVAKANGFTRFTAIQNQYSLLERDAEAQMLPLCERLDIAFIPFFPLAKGLLTGKYRRDAVPPADGRLAKQEQIATDEQWSVLERLGGFASGHDLTMLQLAIGGLLGRPAVASVIAGASRPDQIVSNAEAASWIPDTGQLAELQTVLSYHHVPDTHEETT
jgi:aryl-alcohol dehydrogenase-like predicted oxidoreductase